MTTLDPSLDPAFDEAPMGAASCGQSALTARGRIRLFHNGFVFSSPGMNTHSHRYSATLLIALDGGTEFELAVEGGRTLRCGAAALRPFVTKAVRAAGVPFICLDMSPNHPHYRLFRAIEGDGCLVLPRACLSVMDRAMNAFHAGTLSCTETREMIWRAVDLVAPLLPQPIPIDPRVRHVMALLEAEPGCSVERMAEETRLSRDRLSHLFSAELGLTLRKYVQTMKVHAAARFFGSGMSMTEIAVAAGFADSAHFSKVWSRCFGAPPAYFFSRDTVALYPLPRSVSEVVVRHPDRPLRDMLPETAFAYPEARA